jgi:ELWxxDGT repeat protein
MTLIVYCTPMILAEAQQQHAYQVHDLVGEGMVRRFVPIYPVHMGDQAYFFADDGQHGSELWVTDGTSQGTTLVRDINPGWGGSDRMRSRTVAGAGQLWMFRDDKVHGVELWTSDGTAVGTKLVKDITPGPYPSWGIEELAWKDLVFFTVSAQLWVSDGSAEGTYQLPVPERPTWRFVGATDERVIFGAEGKGSWSSDGTEAGTSALLSPSPSRASVAPLDGKLYFRSGETELWVTDGTDAGAGMVVDIGAPFSIGSGAGALYLSSYDSSNRLVIWRSDGTAQGTVEVTALTADRNYALYFSGCGSEVLFGIFNDTTQRYELWSTDGSAGGTEMLHGGFLTLKTYSEDLGGRVLIVASETSDTETEVWVTDGTAAGTKHLIDNAHMHYGSPWFTRINSSLAMFNTYTDGEHKIWVSDGTVSGTHTLDVQSATYSSSYPASFTPLGEQVVFTANIYQEPPDLWVSDGSAAGTMMLDERMGAPLVAENGRVYYSGHHPALGYQPHVSDGTPRGTHALADLGDDAPAYYEMAVAGGHIYMVGVETTQQRLWRSDGTSFDTELLTDFNPDWNSCAPDFGFSGCISYPFGLTPIGNMLYLVAETYDAYDRNWQLWRIDDSESSLTLLMEGVPDSGMEPPKHLTAVGDALYFFAAPDIFNGPWALWRCSASDSAPTQVWVAPDPYMNEMVVVGNELLYLFDHQQLWKHDGVDATLVTDFGLLDSPGFASQLTVVGGRLFFIVTTEAQGPELWVSDGTPGGTGLVTEIRPGPQGSYPESLRAVGELLLFAADDGVTGSELWVSDGSARGTVRVTDIAPGPAASSPEGMTLAGDLVYFAADDGLTGRELWAVQMQVVESLAAGELFADGFESGGLEGWSQIVQ